MDGAKSAVAGFLDLINQLDQDCFELPLGKQTHKVLQGSGLLAMYEAEKSDKAETRVENLKELVQCHGNLFPDRRRGLIAVSWSFLRNAALESGEEQADAHQDAVQLMTLHSAKGLEFPLCLYDRHGRRGRFIANVSG